MAVPCRISTRIIPELSSCLQRCLRNILRRTRNYSRRLFRLAESMRRTGSAHHPDVHRRVAPGAVTSRSRIRGGRRASAQAALPAAPERRYALREESFRDAVLSAYGGRCAISHLPEPRLLDAAHIVKDADEQLGQPIVTNGLPLTKIHHAAFDAHLTNWHRPGFPHPCL
jgi:predicted restriction endonuclease